jgi:hypothetical protein
MLQEQSQASFGVQNTGLMQMLQMKLLQMALQPSVSQMSENVGASTSRNPKGFFHSLYRDNFTFTLQHM